MCGNVGVAGRITMTEKKVLKDLLIMDSLRGMHSTGIAVINDDGETDWLKGAFNGTDFVDLKKYDKIIAGADRRVIIGHNRYATQGGINNKNAHPFEHDNIIGVHNGTLRNKHVLPNHLDFDVDSDNLYYAIAKEGIEETIGKVLGAWALVFWDSDDKMLRFLRNNERTLFFCYSADNKTLFWASEPYMLQAALWRNDVKHTEITAFAADMLYTFDLDLSKRVQQPIEKPVVKKLEGSKSTWTNKNTGRSSGRKQPTTKKAANSNVKTLPPAKNTSKSPTYLDTLGYKDNTELEFTVDKSNAQYAIGTTLDGSQNTVRIHTSSPQMAKSLVEYDGFFKSSKIIGWKKPSAHKDDGYVCVKMLDVTYKKWTDFQMTPDGDEEESASAEPFRHDHRGDRITKADFVKRYHSCSNCTANLEFDDQDLTFVSTKEAICGACKDLPIVQNIINLH